MFLVYERSGIKRDEQGIDYNHNQWFLSQFELNNVRLLQKKGYQVHYATNFGVPIYEVKDETLRNMGVVLHHISIEKIHLK